MDNLVFFMIKCQSLGVFVKLLQSVTQAKCYNCIF